MTKEEIKALAKSLGADAVGIASMDRFEGAPKQMDPRYIMPEAKSMIVMLFRVMRGSLRGIEEGTFFSNYSAMGYGGLTYNYIPMTVINLCKHIEDEGYEAIPQRKNPLIMNEENETNPEVDYNDIKRGVKNEGMLDFLNCAVQCGLGERSMINTLLTKEYGPFIRYCFIITDAEIEPTELEAPSLCDRCGECIKACPGKAIGDDGILDTWRCAVYYNGANGSKNPFMPPDAYIGFDNRLDIINGVAEFDVEGAKEILDSTFFYPPSKHYYRTSICGRACDRACYIHLEEKGVLTRKFKKKFREGDDWKLDTKQFDTLKREKEWDFTTMEKRK
jgi:ferredoxin